MSYLDGNDNVRYIIKCSLKYPASLHTYTEDLPLGYNRIADLASHSRSMGLTPDAKLLGNWVLSSKLDLSCHDKSDIWVSDKLLKLYVSLGMELIAVTGVLSYEVSDHLRHFAELCIESRSRATNSFYAHFGKAIANLAVGKTMQKRNNIRSIVCTKQKSAERYLSKTRYVDATPVSSSMAIINVERKKGLVCKNLLIGYHVLQESIYMLYDLHYNHIKRIFGDRAYMLYSQVDSAMIRLTNVPNFLSSLEKLSHVLDLSTIPEDVYLKHIKCNQGPGSWKFEGWNLKQFLSLRQKSYSVLERNCIVCDNDTQCLNCTKCKGIKKQKISHQLYLDILQRKHSGVFSYNKCSITRYGTIQVNSANRQFLSLTDGSRVWISDNYSLPFGHYKLVT